MYGLIDCNNFFASCEKIFDPSLENKPIVVLSNNDGCVIARSNEAKKLGIPMGAPFFKYRDIIEKSGVKVFSSNYELYGDISARVMSAIKYMVKEVEIYSIDEAFISLKEIPNQEIVKYAFEIKETIFKWTGITVSVGIGKTKTLAKLANHIAKRQPLLCIYDNIFDISNLDLQHLILKNTKLDTIWGISHRWAEKIQAIGINNALELRDSNIKIIRRAFGVVMEKIILELRNIPSYDLENSEPNKQNIISSRSFGRSILNLKELEEAIATHVSKACIRLRGQGSKACGIYVFLRYKKHNKLLKISSYINFINTSSDSIFITKEAKKLLHQIYREGDIYKKAGIMLICCLDNKYIQKSFFNDQDDDDQLMEILDQSNQKFGKNTLFFASEGMKLGRYKTSWQMKRNLKSPSYTSNWRELALVR